MNDQLDPEKFTRTAFADGPRLLADIGESVGLKIEQYGDELMAQMRSVLPAAASINNPLDTGSTPAIGRQLYGADLDSQTYLTNVFTTLLESPEVAAVLLVLQETEGTTEQALDVELQGRATAYYLYSARRA